MTTYYVTRRDDRYYVRNLGNTHCRSYDEWHVMLLARDDSDEIENPRNAKLMRRALYDLMQWHEGVRNGDEFVTPHGHFRLVDTWTVEQIEETPAQAKARRALVRRMEARNS